MRKNRRVASSRPDVAATTAIHRPRMGALVDAGADFLACETLPTFAEAEALLALTVEFDVESWFSFSLRDGALISDGTPLAAVAELGGSEPRVVAVGVNCVPLHLVPAALTALGKAGSKPLVTYPNSGESYDASLHFASAYTLVSWTCLSHRLARRELCGVGHRHRRRPPGRPDYH